jgi:hypothetical protein
MRKRLIRDVESLVESRKAVAVTKWLDVIAIAQVEISCEDEGNPIESALTPGADGEWCAAAAGEQIIRLVFDTPQAIRRIHVMIEERERFRTQEYVFRWSDNIGGALREICRQQWNFSPTGSTREVENHSVDLRNVAVLELSIKPDISGGDARARLSKLRIA